MNLHLTPYAIKRDHSNSTGFFRVDVPEAAHRGYGFQVRVGARVFGLSVWWIVE